MKVFGTGAASAQGDCTNPAPLSLNVTSGPKVGVSMPLPGTIGR
jgi:hypothetical protein